MFDNLPDSEPEPTPEPTADETTEEEPTITVVAHQRRGHGRKPLPQNLPRQEHELDLSDAEKRCPCCDRVRARIGVDTSERLDYQRLLSQVLLSKYCDHCVQGEAM